MCNPNLFVPRRTYMPNKVSYVLDIWRTELAKINEKAGQSLADPQQYENLFPGFYESIKTQQFLLPERTTLLPAGAAIDVSCVVFCRFLLKHSTFQIFPFRSR